LFIIQFIQIQYLWSSCDLNLDNAPNTCETLGDNTLTDSFIVASWFDTFFIKITLILNFSLLFAVPEQNDRWLFG